MDKEAVNVEVKKNEDAMKSYQGAFGDCSSMYTVILVSTPYSDERGGGEEDVMEEEDLDEDLDLDLDQDQDNDVDNNDNNNNQKESSESMEVDEPIPPHIN